ncbi:MAG: S-CspCI protein [Alphaproteobacteria bacterium]|nr:MAG: S-CspCI protein [Alphaproteobacteria bacterium]
MMPKVSDLFELRYGHSLELNRLTKSTRSQAINFVGRSARNNGVTARVEPVPGLAAAEGGAISVALNGQGGAGVAFLQPMPFYCGFHVMILSPKEEMSEQEKLWWAMCITANRFRFGFGRQANRTLKDLELPPTEDMPSWVAGFDTAHYEGAELSQTLGDVELRDPTTWTSFRIGELFDIRKGQRLTKAKMIKGEVPYVGASDSFNGVTARVGQTPIHAKNTISVTYNGSVAEAFFQPEAYWASDDVNVLYPLNFELTPAVGLFTCAVIRLEKYRFNYGRKWHLDRMRESLIRLPSNADGAPDWDHMEAFMKCLPYSSQLAGPPQSVTSGLALKQ